MIDWLQMVIKTDKTAPWATASLLISNTIVYIFLCLFYDFSIWNFFVPSDDALITWGQYNKALFERIEIYRLMTALFVHANILHLASNLLFLTIFGLRFEELRNSKKEFFLIYFCSGIVGNILTLSMGSEYVSVGASGAIFGIFGANLMILRKNYRQQVKSALFVALIFFSMTISVDTNILAHAGGLVTGLIMGYYINEIFRTTPPIKTIQRRPRRRRR